MVFPVVMYECESWTIKKAGCWRIDAFEMRCWRRLLRIPWTARRSNQSILKEINPEYSFECWCWRWSWSSSILSTWWEELIHWRNCYAFKDRRQEEKGMTKDKIVGWLHAVDGHEFEQALGVGEGHGDLVCCSPWGRKESDTTDWLSNKS